MSMKIEVVDTKSFIKDFKSTFENALLNMPILPDSLKIIDISFTIIVEGREYVFELDCQETVKENIFRIRQALEDSCFPVILFTDVREESFSSYEIKEMLKQGVTLEDALSKVKVTSKYEKYIVHKVLVKQDRLILRNEANPEDEVLYQMSMPVTIFLKRLREGSITPEQAGELLKEKTVFSKKIYPVQEWNKIIEMNNRNTGVIDDN